MKVLKYSAVLFLLGFLSFQSFAQAETFKLTKSEKIKILQTLLKKEKLTVTEIPEEGRAVHLYFYETPKDIIALFSQRKRKEKVNFLLENDLQNLWTKKSWQYYEIGPFSFYGNYLTASIGVRTPCYSQTFSFKFYRYRGKLKAERLGYTFGHCAPKIDEKIVVEEAAPEVKTKKPNE